MGFSGATQEAEVPVSARAHAAQRSKIYACPAQSSTQQR